MLERHKHVLEVVGNVDLVDGVLAELEFFVFNGVFEVFGLDEFERVLSPEEFARIGAHEDGFEGWVDFDGSDLLAQGDGFL